MKYQQRLIKYLKNYSIWIVTSFEKRILRGIIGFTVNLSFLLIVKYIQFRNIINVYFVLIIIYLSTGFICYGLLPKVFEIIRISNLICLNVLKQNLYLIAEFL